MTSRGAAARRYVSLRATRNASTLGVRRASALPGGGGETSARLECAPRYLRRGNQQPWACTYASCSRERSRCQPAAPLLYGGAAQYNDVVAGAACAVDLTLSVVTWVLHMLISPRNAVLREVAGSLAVTYALSSVSMALGSTHSPWSLVIPGARPFTFFCAPVFIRWCVVPPLAKGASQRVDQLIARGGWFKQRGSR